MPPAPNLKLILLPPDKFHTLGKFSPKELKRTEQVLGVRLPAAYVALLKKQNGASLRLKGIYPKQKPLKSHTSRPIYEFDAIAGVHPTRSCSLTSNTQLASEEWGAPKGLIPFDGDGHWWLCLDYRNADHKGEPVITHYDTEDKKEFRVADSFDALLRGLIRADDEYIFTITDPLLKSEALDKLLRGIGCRANRFKTPDVWEWPKYLRDKFDKAFIAVSPNSSKSAAHSDFPELPPKQLLLTVHVDSKGQDACIRELAAALGDRARLVHQPPDRKPVRLDNLPSISIKKVGAAKLPAFNPEEAHAAFWSGDLAKVRDLLKKGVTPNKRPWADNRTPFELACIKGHTSIVRLLLAHPKAKPFKGDLLARAVGCGHADIAGLLLKAGAKPKPEHLAEAVRRQSPAAVKVMLDSGVRPTPHLLATAEGMGLVSDDPRYLKKMETDKATVVRLLRKAMND